MSIPSIVLNDAQRAFRQRDFARALTLAESVLACTPESLPALALLVNAANALQDFVSSSLALKRLCILRPGNQALTAAYAIALNNLGSLHFHRGEIDVAAMQYDRALAVDPVSQLALSNIAACAERLREHARAEHYLLRLIELAPHHGSAYLRLSRAQRALGKNIDAVAAIGTAERYADTAETRREIGLEFLHLGDAARASPLLEADQADNDTLARIAQMQALGNNAGDARKRWTELAERNARHGDERGRFRAERNAALALPWVFPDADAIDQERGNYEARVERLITDWPAARLRTTGVTLDDLACSRFTLAYQGGNDRVLATRYGDWLAAAAEAIFVDAPCAASSKIRRIGLVSARWNQGTIAAYFGSWIGALRRAGNEVLFFAIGDREDTVSSALAAQADRAERLPSSLGAAACRLRDAELDLLIYPEIGLDSTSEVLAALRLAPRQWAAWGHPVTTGLPTIDRYLSIAAMEPPDASEHYREPLALLPGIGTNYARAPRAAAVALAEFGLHAGSVYTLPHAPLKLHPDIDSLVIEIARLDPDAQFVMVNDEIPAQTRALRSRLDTSMREAGLHIDNHCRWLPRLNVGAFRSLLTSSDVILDSVNFSGGNTSLDALAQCTPVITIEGLRMRARQTAAMLRILDSDEMIAQDVLGAAAVAVDLAHSPAKRANLAAKLDANAGRLFGQDAPLRTLSELVERNGMD